ncbi:ArnT family glycosyltransferase [Candidatus Omnitrophota bacterium]
MRRTTIDILFLLLITAHLIGQLVLLGDFSVDDLALMTRFEDTKDAPAHQQNIQEIKHIIKDGDKHSLIEILTFQRGYPPMFHYIMALIASFSFGEEYYVIRCGVLLFSVLIFFLLYGYFRRKNDHLTGLWAVLITACSPFFLRYSTATTPHMFMGLCVFFLFVLCERTDNFRNRGWSLFFGIMSGVCLFAKHEVLIYCFALYCISAIPVIVKPTKQQIKNLVFSLYLFGNIFIYFAYFYIYDTDISHRLAVKEYGRIKNAGLFSLQAFSFCGRMLFKNLMGPYIMGIACVATVIHFIKPQLYRKRNVIFFCVIVLMIFTFVPAKWPEYISPLVVFIALICARAISMIRFRIVRSVLVIVACYLTVSAYAGPLFDNRICTRDITQYEYTKVWDMVEERIVGDVSDIIQIEVLGIYQSKFIHSYLNLRAIQEGYSVDAGSVSKVAYPLNEINGFPSIPLFIYVSNSEKKTWPIQAELWDQFEGVAEPKDKNITLQHWQKVVDSKDFFVEVARTQVILESKRVYVFLYENRERLKENEK